MANATVKAIISTFLLGRGYDGLFNTVSGCGCQTLDLAPCENLSPNCEAGYKVACGDTCEHEPSRWHIQREKPAPEETRASNPKKWCPKCERNVQSFWTRCPHCDGPLDPVE